MLSYSFPYAFRFGVFSVFCNRDSAITPYATPHPGFDVYMKEHVNYKDLRPTEGGKLVQILFQPSIRVKRETAPKRIGGFIYSYIIIIIITITIIINFGV